MWWIPVSLGIICVAVKTLDALRDYRKAVNDGNTIRMSNPLFDYCAAIPKEEIIIEDVECEIIEPKQIENSNKN